MPRHNSILWFVQGVGAAVAVSALGVGVMALLQPRSSWVMFGFEIVVLISAVLAIRLGRGAYQSGPSLGLLAVAGAVLVGSAFGYLGGGRVLFGTDMKMLVVARALASASLVGVAAWLVLARDPRATLPLFVKGCLLVGAMLGVIVVLWKAQGRINALGDVGQLGIGMAAFAVITGLLAASVHTLVRAFEAGLRRA